MDMDKGLHGSLLHILEYGEYFRSLGYEIHIGAMFLSEENSELARNLGFTVHKIKDIPLEETWDLVYALHMLIFPALLAKGLKYRKAIGATLSAFGDIELPPPPQLWPFFDLFTAISEEAAYTYARKYGIRGKFEIIPNPVPLAFMKHEPRRFWKAKPEKVAFISNRPLPDIDQIAQAAPFRMDLIGSHYGNTRRITPEFLLEYDAVMSIGKTVQYCMGLGIPIFQYGHFGGCGYITSDNMLEEEKTNFSGRGSRRKLDPQSLVAELQNGYEAACVNATPLCAASRARYDIEALIKRQLALINQKEAVRPALRNEALLYAEGAKAALRYMGSALAKGQSGSD